MKYPNNKIKVVITTGDESGIGPEIILKALYSKEIEKNIDILIVGSKSNLEKTYKNLKKLKIKNIVDPKNYEIFDVKMPFDIKQQKKATENQVLIT